MYSQLHNTVQEDTVQIPFTMCKFNNDKYDKILVIPLCMQNFNFDQPFSSIISKRLDKVVECSMKNNPYLRDLKPAHRWVKLRYSYHSCKSITYLTPFDIHRTPPNKILKETLGVTTWTIV